MDSSKIAESHMKKCCQKCHSVVQPKSGLFPLDWNFARAVPIPKAGKPECPSTYRPIIFILPNI